MRALWPLFGIANQLLAATALTIATTMLVRTGRARFAWVTGVPLAWLLAVTGTAGIQKIAHPDPRIGFLAQAAVPGAPAIEVFKARVDALMAAIFLVLVATIVASAVRRWVAGGPEGPGGPLGTAFGEIPPVGGRHRCC